MIAYKLFRVRKDGSLGPLFINQRQRIPRGRWLDAESHPTKGFAYRPGWHCTMQPWAPHLKDGPASGRAWFMVEIKNYTPYQRPAHQGGRWFTANRMRVLMPVPRRLYGTA